MSKLSKEELLEWLYCFWNEYQQLDGIIIGKRVGQAYQQIKEIIQKEE